MTFVENIYSEINRRRPVSTDAYSKQWLGQCRSYYTSIKSRNIEASNQSLIHLMNKLLEQQAVMNSKPHALLQVVAKEYGALAKQVAKEIVRRSKLNATSNPKITHLIHREVQELFEVDDYMPILIV